MFVLVLSSLALQAAAPAQAPFATASVAVETPVVVTTLDTAKLDGEPARVAWSDDGSELYVQTLKGQFGAPDTTARHFVVAVSNPRVTPVDAEPEWASQYWFRKSHQQSPDVPNLKIDLEVSTKTDRSTAAPMGGDMARGAVGGTTGTSAAEAISAINNTVTVPVYTMRLHGQTIGEFVNAALQPGLTFGWAPKGTQAMAYVHDGKLILVDGRGTRHEVKVAKDAILPAWSNDGTRLAWLEKRGKSSYELKVARINW